MMKYRCKDLVLLGFSFIYTVFHWASQFGIAGAKKTYFKLTNQVAPSSVTGSSMEERERLRSTTSAFMQKSHFFLNPFSDKHNQLIKGSLKNSEPVKSIKSDQQFSKSRTEAKLHRNRIKRRVVSGYFALHRMCKPCKTNKVACFSSGCSRRFRVVQKPEFYLVLLSFRH